MVVNLLPQNSHLNAVLLTERFKSLHFLKPLLTFCGKQLLSSSTFPSLHLQLTFQLSHSHTQLLHFLQTLTVCLHSCVQISTTSLSACICVCTVSLSACICVCTVSLCACNCVCTVSLCACNCAHIGALRSYIHAVTSLYDFTCTG